MCVERFDRQVDGKRAEVVIAEPSPPVLVTVLFARAFPEQVAGPKQHEAVGSEETTKHPEDTVVAELRAGYRMHDRVLRPALVKVARPPV